MLFLVSPYSRFHAVLVPYFVNFFLCERIVYYANAVINAFPCVIFYYAKFNAFLVYWRVWIRYANDTVADDVGVYFLASFKAFFLRRFIVFWQANHVSKNGFYPSILCQ